MRYLPEDGTKRENEKRESNFEYEFESPGSVSGGTSVSSPVSLLGWRLLQCQVLIWKGQGFILGSFVSLPGLGEDSSVLVISALI